MSEDPAKHPDPATVQSEPMSQGPLAPPPPSIRMTLPPPQPMPRAAAQEKPFARGFGIGIGAALGVGLVTMALLVVSLLGMGLVVARAASGGRPDFSSAYQHIWGPTNASNTMLALNISGAIDGAGNGTMFTTGTYGYEIAEQLDALEADDYSGVLLLMDTPGGSIYGARAIAEAVIRYQERTGRKVVAYVQSMSASGGMYAMAPADLIISDYGTFVGSIGVIFGPFDRYREVTGLTGNILTSGVETEGGITREYLTRGTGKDFGNPFRDMTEEERAVYGQGMDVEYAQFVDFVAEHRGIPAERIRSELGAFMFDPQTATEKGLVDEVMGRPDAFRAAANLNEVDANDTKVVSPALPNSLGAWFGVEQRVPGHNIPLSAADGVAATSQICVGAPTLLAFAGDFSQVCG